MKKDSSKGYIILGILFVLISIIAFAVPSAKNYSILGLLWLYRAGVCCSNYYLESGF